MKVTNINKLASSLSGPLTSLGGDIKVVYSMDRSIALEVKISDDKVTGDFIFTLWNEINSRIDDTYYESEGSTTIRIRELILTGGIDIDGIGISLNMAATTPLSMNKVKWIKEPFTLTEIKDMLIVSPQETRLQMLLEEDELHKLNHSLSQIRAQKNVPHNLQIHLDFIEEGTFMMNDLEVKYKLPEGMELKYKSDPRNHNKITGVLDFDFLPIHVECPMNPASGKVMYNTLTDRLTDKFNTIFKSNDLVPDRFAPNVKNPRYNFIINFTG
jgi:hypothetical protein